MSRSRVVLVTGGVRSGKSGFAEEYVLRQSGDEVAIYLATAEAGDAEMLRRIERHRLQRPAHWVTFEEPIKVSRTVASYPEEAAAVLLDCLTLLTSNVLLAKESAAECELLCEIIQEMETLIQYCRKREMLLVIVTNEVGAGIVPEYRLGRIFRDLAGRINQHIALLADEVYLMVAGLPLKLKG